MKKLILLMLLIPMTVSAASSITIVWNPNTEPDMDHYNVYINGEVVGTVTHPAHEYPNIVLPDGSYEFYVTAVDHTGNESGPSNKVTKVIDNPPSPPTGCQEKLP